jgi:hypothetical protein
MNNRADGMIGNIDDVPDGSQSSDGTCGNIRRANGYSSDSHESTSNSMVDQDTHEVIDDLSYDNDQANCTEEEIDIDDHSFQTVIIDTPRREHDELVRESLSKVVEENVSTIQGHCRHPDDDQEKAQMYEQFDYGYLESFDVIASTQRTVILAKAEKLAHVSGWLPTQSKDG